MLYISGPSSIQGKERNESTSSFCLQLSSVYILTFVKEGNTRFTLTDIVSVKVWND